ncbi:MAG: ABC transporter substrate-binding protein [Chloroflexi bacterium]|nr:ABC transporter substrate-binding protein [Chloroflexota bacterium]
MRKLFLAVFALLVLAIVPAVAAQDLTPVSLVLKWVPQAQFAGYYAAEALGYYEEEGLDVEIIAAGVDINPQQLVASGDVESASTGWATCSPPVKPVRMSSTSRRSTSAPACARSRGRTAA